MKPKTALITLLLIIICVALFFGYLHINELRDLKIQKERINNEADFSEKQNMDIKDEESEAETEKRLGEDKKKMEELLKINDDTEKELSEDKTEQKESEAEAEKTLEEDKKKMEELLNLL